MGQFLSYECKVIPLMEWLMYLIVKYYHLKLVLCIFNNLEELEKINYFLLYFVAIFF